MHCAPVFFLMDVAWTVVKLSPFSGCYGNERLYCEFEKLGNCRAKIYSCDV